ncbi:MAG: HIT family protein [Gammaproteobacteria bacterium]|jgi:diadenosine tetraphosphate (Ap4A) HIT family hydrolase|nr:HIT family protein [Gammaproteobacteria bacterium]MBT3725764.1 HIT family protein [Gammaproteobacteria bacterium]MBT4077519.1 HIT family protein [Gammaproteobacteria bacterium]MBT4196066.1 HIT family protein [Gammaproteobacteria bacterium]MBT4448813.1 HIT family protein [Gammaproteobacteria bacterium]
MSKFSLDERLVKDCHVIVETDGLSYLLHSNAEVAWFILVPHTNQTEFYQLDSLLQKQLCEQVNLLSAFVKSHFNSDKINVATIGNVVSQMHIHVIGRRTDDVYWPDVVWGRESEKTYNSEQISLITEQLTYYLKLNKSL